jgi:hypothetical protein
MRGYRPILLLTALLALLAPGCARPAPLQVIDPGRASVVIASRAVVLPTSWPPSMRAAGDLNERSWCPNFLGDRKNLDGLLLEFLKARGTFQFLDSAEHSRASPPSELRIQVIVQDFATQVDLGGVILASGSWGAPLGVPITHYLRFIADLELTRENGEVLVHVRYDSTEQTRFYSLYNRPNRLPFDVSLLLCDAFRAFSREVEAHSDRIVAAQLRAPAGGNPK